MNETHVRPGDGHGVQDGLLECEMGAGATCECGGTKAGWDAVRDNAREVRPNVQALSIKQVSTLIYTPFLFFSSFFLIFLQTSSLVLKKTRLPLGQNNAGKAPFGLPYIRLVRLLFSAGTVFFSHNVSARTVFSSHLQPNFGKPLTAKKYDLI